MYLFMHQLFVRLCSFFLKNLYFLHGLKETKFWWIFKLNFNFISSIFIDSNEFAAIIAVACFDVIT